MGECVIGWNSVVMGDFDVIRDRASNFDVKC